MIRSIRIFYLGIFLILPFIGCDRDFVTLSTNRHSREMTSLEKKLTQSDNAFGIKLFKEINRCEGDNNIFISPLSVATALGMTLNGAAGSTEKAIRNTLELSGLTQEEINASFKSMIDLLVGLDPKVLFQIANSIWYRNTIDVEPSFLDLNRTFFYATVQGLDFDSPSAPGIINDWVNEKTYGKIDRIIDEIDPSSVMFLINAVYFKGTWTFEFDKKMTVDDQFIKPNGVQTSCKMMAQTNQFSYLETDDFQSIDLPYGDGRFAMSVFLPKPEKSIDALVDELSTETWNQWMGNYSLTELTLQMPKFTIKYELKLNDVLSAFGMGIAFTEQADFTRIRKTGGLFINQVKHKTYVDVSEEGTEAAAVTVVEIWLTSTDPGVQIMRVDRPFVFVIRERISGTILFIGKIVSPTG